MPSRGHEPAGLTVTGGSVEFDSAQSPPRVRPSDWTHLPDHGYDRTSFVGRDVEILILTAGLKQPSERLVTLTGPGGVGKSRLAGTTLANVHDSRSAVPVIRADLHEVRDEKQLRARIEHLRRTHPLDEGALLLLDGFDGVVDATAEAVDTLLSRYGRLRVLATGRQPLRVYGERLRPVPPLSVPAPPYRLDVSELQDYPAVALFVDRARAVQPHFSLNSQNARTVAEICARLDGLPLAIELATERLPLLPVESLVRRLREGRPVLGGEHPTGGGRRRSVMAPTQQDLDALPECERALLGTLSVCVGSIGLSTIESLSGLPADRAERTVESLANRQLLRVSAVEDEPHCAMYSTVRALCRGHLASGGGLEEARDAHAEFFRDQVYRAEPHLTGPRQSQWLRRLALEHDDIQAALTRLESSGRHRDVARAALALHRFWLVRGPVHVGEKWLAEAAATLLEDPASRGEAARATMGRGTLASAGGDTRGAVDCFRHAVGAYHELGDSVGEVIAQAHLCAAHLDPQHPAVHRAAADVLAAAGAETAPSGVADAALALTACVRQTDAGLSSDLLAAAGALYSRVQDLWGEARVLELRAQLAVARGDATLGETLVRESLHQLRALEEHTFLPTVLEHHARLLWQRLPDQGHRVARLLAAASGIREATGARPLTASRGEDAPLRELRRALSGPEYEAARREGRLLSPKAAADEALSAPPVADLAPAASHPVQLTARQYEVALLVSHGLTNRQVAHQLHLSEWTVVNHIRHVMRKLDAPSRIHVAQWVLRRQRQHDAA